MMPRYLFLVPLFCLLSSLPALGGDGAFVSDSTRSNIRNTGPVVYSAASYAARDKLRRGHADKAYTGWVEEGFKGDIEALAMAGMLCKAEEIKPSSGWKVRFSSDPKPEPVCPVPARFWEQSLVDLLGEGEGTLLLGLAGIELIEVDPHRSERDYAPVVEALTLRSALAGNADGMNAAALTSEGRAGKTFVPPAGFPEVDVIPAKYFPTATPEGRYWLSQSAHAGNLDAITDIAWAYTGEWAKISPDSTKAEMLYKRAVKNGGGASAKHLGLYYAVGAYFPQDCEQSVYYGAIAVRLQEKGRVVLDDEKNYPRGHGLEIMRRGFLEGNLIFADDDNLRVTKVCITQVQFDAAVERSLPAYEEAKAALDKDKAKQDALYAAAKARLPEIKAAYEKAVYDASVAAHKGQ